VSVCNIIVKLIKYQISNLKPKIKRKKCC